MKICPTCSGKNYDNAEICFNCKTPITNIPVLPDPPSYQQTRINPYMQQPYYQYPNNAQVSEQLPNRSIAQPQLKNKDTNSASKSGKKTLLLVLCIVICILIVTNGITLYLLLKSRGNSASHIMQESGESKIEEKSPYPNPVPTEIYQELQFGQQFDALDMDIHIDLSEWADEIIPRNTVGSYTIEDDNPEEKYFYVIGTIKNNTGNEIRLSRSILANFKFNDKYSYPGEFYCIEENVENGSLVYLDRVRPLEKRDFYISVSVPNEVRDLFDHCVLTIGYKDDFSYLGSSPRFEELDKVYQLHIQ